MDGLQETNGSKYLGVDKANGLWIHKKNCKSSSNNKSSELNKDLKKKKFGIEKILNIKEDKAKYQHVAHEINIEKLDF